MASVASQLIEEVTAHAQSDNLEDAREICAEGTYFPNNLRTTVASQFVKSTTLFIRQPQYTVVYDRSVINKAVEHPRKQRWSRGVVVLFL